MKRNMHIRTLAIIVATMTGIQISEVSTVITGENNVVYAATNSVELNNDNAKDLSFQLSNKVELSSEVSSTTKQVVTTTPAALTVDYSTGAVKVKETLGNGNQFKWCVFDSKQAISTIKLNDKLSDKFPGKNFAATQVITSGDNHKYLVVTEVDSSNQIKRIYEVQILTSASGKAIKSVSISGTERVGKTLSANVTYNTGVLIPTVKYQWLKCSSKDGTYKEISGETGSEYKLESDDRDDYIKVRVTSTINDSDTITSERTSSVDKRSSSSSSSSSSSASTADSDEIENDIRNADDNETVTETIDDEPKIEKEVFEYLQNHSGRTLVLSGDDYEWTFKGKDIKDSSVLDGKLDTRIETDSPNELDIKELTNGADVVNLYFKYSGKLPGKAKVKVDIDSDSYNGDEMYLYYYNEDKKVLELVESNVKVEDGQATFTIEHCSDYILSKVPIAGAKTDNTINNNTNTSANTATQSQGSWKRLDYSNWQYIENGFPVKGWKYVNYKWYYMNNDGIMQTGWRNVGGNWYYLEESGAMETGWIYINGNWYYLQDDGAMATGSRVINGQSYFFNTDGSWQ